jgi:tetratricopeptide (TPR) repeat protein
MAESTRMTKSAPTRESPSHVHAERLFQIATRWLRQGKLHEAEHLYRSILDIEPNHFGSLLGLGTVHTQAGKLDGAASMFRQASRVVGNSANIQSLLGDLLATIGRPAEAVACYQRALAVDSRHAETHHNLGVALQGLGRLVEAISHYEQALAIKPDLAEARGSLGNALRALDRPHEAMVQYRKALVIRPDHAEAHNNLAGVLLMLGRSEEAIAHYRQAIAIRPDYAEARFNLGNAFSELGRHDEAITNYEKAIAIRHDFAGAHNNLGNALQKLGRFDDAIVHYRRALGITPDYADAHRNLGNALLALNRNEEAIAHYEKTLAVNPSQAEVHNIVASAHHVLGHSEDACRAYERAVQLAPQRGALHLSLASLKPFTVGDNRLVALENLAADMTKLGAEDRIAVHFALGKAYEDLKLPDQSFHHLIEGNALKRRQMTYDEAATLRTFKRIQQVFTDALMHQKDGGGDLSAVPLFVLGMPRSGTTLVEQILASHSRVFGAGEREDFRQAALSLRGADGAAYPEVIPTLTDQELRQLGSRYVDHIRAAAPAAERIVDKMPLNFCFIGLIHLALPKARIVHVRRDPVDTCFSCFALLFAGNQPYTYDLGELGRYYGAYAALMEHWENVLPQGAMIDVRYEDVVDDLEGNARRIIAHCGLEWEDRCLAFHQTRRPVLTASSVQVRQPIYHNSVGRWRPYAHLLRPLLQALNVEPPGPL